MKRLILGAILRVVRVSRARPRPAKGAEDATLRRATLTTQRPPIIDMHMHADLPPHDVSPDTGHLSPRTLPGVGRSDGEP